jgi:hypothetical protein
MQNIGITLAGFGLFVYLIVEATLAIYDVIQYAPIYQ